MGQPASSTPTDRPTLASVAESIHRAVIDDPVARIVSVRWDHPRDSVHLGFWDVPVGPLHPIDPLVGFIAPTDWDAIGLISAGRLRRLEACAAPPERVLSAVLLQRDEAVASAVGPVGGPVQLLDDPPSGLVPDVLRRVLQLPTSPPDCTTTTLVELTWLDRIATGLLQRHSRGRSWRWLADRHPLRGSGAPPCPEELAGRASAYGEVQTWGDLRLMNLDDELPAARWGPPGGTVAPSCGWFDDGSMSRWMLRHLPPAEALLPDLLSVLPAAVGSDLLRALTEVDGT